MQLSLGFVKGTDFDTVVAVHPVFSPEKEALFRIYIPFLHAGEIAYRWAFCLRSSVSDRSGRAVPGTFLAGPAK